MNHGGFSRVSAMFSRLCMPYDVERFRAGDRNLRFPPVNCNKIRFLWGKIAHGLGMFAEGNDAKSAMKRLRRCFCFADAFCRRFCFCRRRIRSERANGWLCCVRVEFLQKAQNFLDKTEIVLYISFRYGSLSNIYFKEVMHGSVLPVVAHLPVLAFGNRASGSFPALTHFCCCRSGPLTGNGRLK